MKSEYVILLIVMLLIIIELVFILCMLIPRKDEYIKIKEKLLNANGSIKSQGLLYRFVKRLFDITISFSALLFFLPFFLLALLLLKLNGVKSPLKIVNCIGFKNNVAKVYKFNVQYKNEKDISISKFLWKSGLDGLPIFYSVLKGDLTLIGLRKIPLDQKSCEHNLCFLYNYEKPGFLSVGKFIPIKGYSAQEVDVLYLKTRSILFDMKLLRYMLRKALLVSVK